MVSGPTGGRKRAVAAAAATEGKKMARTAKPKGQVIKEGVEVEEFKMSGFTSQDLFNLVQGIRKDIAEIIDTKLAERDAKKALAEEPEPAEEDDHINIEDAKVNLTGIYYDKERGIRTELDWNDAFIKYLRLNGYKGVDDEQVVQHWLAALLKHVEKSIDDKNAIGDSRYT